MNKILFKPRAYQYVLALVLVESVQISVRNPYKQEEYTGTGSFSNETQVNVKAYKEHYSGSSFSWVCLEPVVVEHWVLNSKSWSTTMALVSVESV